MVLFFLFFFFFLFLFLFQKKQFMCVCVQFYGCFPAWKIILVCSIYQQNSTYCAPSDLLCRVLFRIYHWLRDDIILWDLLRAGAGADLFLWDLLRACAGCRWTVYLYLLHHWTSGRNLWWLLFAVKWISVSFRSTALASIWSSLVTSWITSHISIRCGFSRAGTGSPDWTRHKMLRCPFNSPLFSLNSSCSSSSRFPSRSKLLLTWRRWSTVCIESCFRGYGDARPGIVDCG